MNKVLLCPDSVALWAKRRMSEVNRIIPIVSRSEFNINNGVEWLLNRYEGLQSIIIISSHDSFLDDVDLKGQFERRGIKVKSQSSFACSLAVDKIRVKRILDENNITTTGWFTDVYPEMVDFVVKKNDSSMGMGTRYYYKNENIKLDNEYIEPFVEGDEFSVNVFTDSSGNSLVFPSVYKGKTGRDMIHPSSRIRLCSRFKANSNIISQMSAIAVKVGELIENTGFMEVEFIVDTSGRVSILEVNPRVSGTLRMASMACDSMCFDLLFDESELGCNKQLECTCDVLEIPYVGRPLVDEEKKIICTTRATFCFNDSNDMIDKIQTIKRMEEECVICDAKKTVYKKIYKPFEHIGGERSGGTV